ncbi:ABC transporter permease [Candidatus Palauibacter sp.]|uniref:ABC transporter permease n=1 Tax=Candidatus Palauibacter sp. TaxID=3101350 RepID=UPI003B0292E2
MRARFRLLRLDMLRLTRSTGVAVAVVMLLAVGVYAAWRGGRSIEAAGSSAVAAETGYRDQLAYLLSTYPPTTEAGEVLYYLAFPAPQPSLPLAALAQGRTEVETASLRIRLLALEGQLYEHETVNPRLAAAGDLDLAFLLIGLLPLFIIALTYDLVSSEREGGTWNLVRLFARPRRFLALKLASRACLVGVVVAVPVVVAASLAGFGFDGRAAWAVALIALHTLFWFALCLGVASLRRSSAANAMILVGTWVALTLLAPAALSLANAILHPVPEALELTVRQRQGYHEAWDLTKDETMQGFFEDYPEWSDRTVPEDAFTWAWYYAMNHRGDRAARDASRAYADVLREREEWARRWSLLVPPLAAQLALDRLAATDLGAQLAYQDAVRRHHERLKTHFYPVFFATAPINAVDWDQVPVFEPAALEESATRAGLPAASALVLASFVVLAAGVRTSQREPMPFG